MNSNIINLLPDKIANQIAAGEVVQRPSSVVKELLENSVDAGASTIKLILKDSGKTLIQVIDDGIGMNEIDARMCFERHATSKIKFLEDIYNINTKGFRGEALASISAISQMELKTRHKDSEIGIEIIIEGNTIKKQEFCQTPKGTIFSVRNLFYNTPARRKFLKTDAIEYKHILDEFFRVALAHNDITFYLENNNNVVFNLPKGTLKDRIENLFGKRKEGKLIHINEDNRTIKITGFIGVPDIAKKNRSEQYIFVNNRFIKSYQINHAITSAFQGLLREGHFPTYFIYIYLDPKTIDINIHPTKTEIKFDNDEMIYSAIKSTMKYSLGKFKSNEIDFEADPVLERALSFKSKNFSSPQIKVDREFNPFEMEKNNLYSTPKQTNDSWKVLYTGINDIVNNTNISIKEEIDYQEKIELDDTSDDIFQYKNKYIIFSNEEGLNIMNQRLAHIRVLYDNNKSKIFTRVASKQLLYPIEIVFSPQEEAIFSELDDIFSKIGFQIEKKGNQLIIKSIPYFIKDSEVSSFIEEIFDKRVNSSIDIEVEVMEQTRIRHSENKAIENGQKLSKEEMIKLRMDLFKCENYKYTPKGELIYFTLTENEIINNLK